MLREAPAHILDVLVNAEDLLHDQYGRVRSRGRRFCAVGRDLTIRGRDLDLSGVKTVGVGRQRLRGNRLYGRGESNGKRRHQHCAARERGLLQEAGKLGGVGGNSHGGVPLPGSKGARIAVSYSGSTPGRNRSVCPRSAASTSGATI